MVAFFSPRYHKTFIGYSENSALLKVEDFAHEMLKVLSDKEAESCAKHDITYCEKRISCHFYPVDSDDVIKAICRCDAYRACGSGAHIRIESCGHSRTITLYRMDMDEIINQIK